MKRHVALSRHVLAVAIVMVALARVTMAVANTAFSVSNTFGDHMVLQRDRPVVVFGFALPLTVVSFGALQISVVTGVDGIWRIQLPAQPASLTPQTLVFSASTGERVVLQDVLYGDVHFCGGQSNMQFTLLGGSNGGVPNASAEIAAADHYPLIRLFTVGQGTNSTTPLQQLKTIEQPWTVASSATVGVGAWKSFSAVCWFTYRHVFDALGGTVPQGLISNNWGGTPIEHWSSPDALSHCANITDSVLWNAMMAPYAVGPMAIRTAIWYQAEANANDPKDYDCRFPAMISDWRAKFPGLSTFGFVQIAPCQCYGNSTFSEISLGDIRQAQLAPLRSLAKIVFATTIDLVAPWSAFNDIHPKNKQAVSERLSQQLLATEYGHAGPAPPPMYAGAAVLQTGAAQVSVGVELTGCPAHGDCVIVVADPPAPSGLQPYATATWAVQTNDAARTWWPAKAQATTTGVVLIAAVGSGGETLTPVATAYGRAQYPLAAAFSHEGLPVVGWCFSLTGEACFLQ